jgi:hypothetical protein
MTRIISVFQFSAFSHRAWGAKAEHFPSIKAHGIHGQHGTKAIDKRFETAKWGQKGPWRDRLGRLTIRRRLD